VGLQDGLQAQVLIAVLAACAGCGKGSAECTSEVAQLDAFLHQLDRTGVFPDDAGVTLVHRPDLTRDACDSGIMLFVHGDAIDLDGRPATAEDLDRQRERRRQRDPRAPRYVCIAADGAAPWKQVVAAAALAGGEARFAFGRDEVGHAPAHTHVDDEMASIHEATGVASYAATLIKSCAPMKKVFGHVGADESGDSIAKYLIDHTAAAIGECDCAVKPADIASLMWNVMHVKHPAGYLAVAIAPDAPAIAAPADATWASVSAQLAPQTTRANLVIQ